MFNLLHSINGDNTEKKHRRLVSLHSLFHVNPSNLTLLASFTLGQDEKIENVLQAEERNKSQEMEKTNFQEHMEVMECVDEQNDFEIACDEPTEISAGTTLEPPQEDQRASEIADFLDEYGLHCSEDISQQPNVMDGEKHPSWLIDHLDGIKETLEKELIDLQGDLNDPFELNYDDTSEEQLMEEIRKMETSEETENQNANLQATPIYPGARLTIGISALLVMAVVLRDGICDIYDGELYKKLLQHPEVLSSPHNFSFTWNTDGVPVFKSSNFSLWPLYLVVNELSPKKRFSKDSMILAGLWFGSSKFSLNPSIQP